SKDRNAAYEYLAGYAPIFSRSFQEWIEQRRDQVHAQLREALVRRIAAARQLGQWPRVDAIARQLMDIDPLNEEAALALAEAAASTGSKATAIEILDRYSSEVGRVRGDLKLPATLLRNRISEQRFGFHESAVPFVGREES